MELLKVRRQAKKRIYVHNDLSNTAFHLRKQIERKIAAGDRNGISLEIMACLAMLAFTFEAKANFIGAKAVKDWRERQSFKEKIKDICGHIGFKADASERPYKTVLELKELRDSFAHGKPVLVELDETVDVSPEQIDEALHLGAEWESKLHIEFVNQCFEDVDAIWKEWLRLSGIHLFDTLTHGQHTVTIIEKYVDAET
ncbi:hypothetical protein [Rheinheimera pacifica]|uniref:hypothetical protein n=1 Tax=Rheinheimera pacifica TaxID=173990 RepID=UPI002EDA5054